LRQKSRNYSVSVKKGTSFFVVLSAFRNFAAGMRRILLMTRILAAFCAVFLAVLTGWQHHVETIALLL